MALIIVSLSLCLCADLESDGPGSNVQAGLGPKAVQEGSEVAGSRGKQGREGGAPRA